MRNGAADSDNALVRNVFIRVGDERAMHTKGTPAKCRRSLFSLKIR
jgi:hypothetical protein